GVTVDMPQMLTRRGWMREGFTRLGLLRRAEKGQLGADDDVADELGRMLQREPRQRRVASRALGCRQRCTLNRADVFQKNPPLGEGDFPPQARIPELRRGDRPDADPLRQAAP